MAQGSSAVPLLSPDEKTIAFLRRVDGKTTLWLHDLASGAERQGRANLTGAKTPCNWVFGQLGWAADDGPGYPAKHR